MDNVRKRLPELHLKVCIADLEGNLFGCQSSLITAAPEAESTLASAVESVRLPGSREIVGALGGKSKQLASTLYLRKGLRTQVAPLGIDVVDAAI